MNAEPRYRAVARKVYNWAAAHLGERPDEVVAAELGCAVGTVCTARHRRGIPSYSPSVRADALCPQCSTVRAAEEFVSRKRGQNKHWTCKSCRAARRADYSARKNQEPEAKRRARDYARTYYALHGFRGPLHAALVAWVNEQKARPCLDCGGRFPSEAMDFDHRDGSTKKFEISSVMARTRSQTEVREEIAKCDLICANCHRIRTKFRADAVRAERRVRLLGQVGVA